MTSEGRYDNRLINQNLVMEKCEDYTRKGDWVGATGDIHKKGYELIFLANFFLVELVAFKHILVQLLPMNEFTYAEDMTIILWIFFRIFKNKSENCLIVKHKITLK